MKPAEHERSFALFGSHVRILVGAHPAKSQSAAEILLLSLEEMLRRVHAELSRFEPMSGLAELNRSPHDSNLGGHLLATFVADGVDAGALSDGLVDFTLLGPLEKAGYVNSRIGEPSAALADALAVAPDRRPATPDPRRRWQLFEVDRKTDFIRRPPGVRIDGGGIVKGLAADLAGARLSDFSSWAVDCGGDILIGGTAGLPRRVDLENPLDPGNPMCLELSQGGIATSGLGNQIWPVENGFAHHLIDPGTGAPAWTGIVQATAIAGTAREAEVRAKSALLSGPGSARGWLEESGGVLVFDSGEVEVVGDLNLGSPDALATR